MNNLLTRRNALVLGVLVPAAILVGLMAWLFIPRSDPAGPVSAQQAFEDACADATPVSHVDLTTEGTATYNSDPYTWRRVIRVAPNAEHHLTTAPSSSEKAEMIIVESPSDGTRSDGSGGSVALYTRSADDAVCGVIGPLRTRISPRQAPAPADRPLGLSISVAWRPAGSRRSNTSVRKQSVAWTPSTSERRALRRAHPAGTTSGWTIGLILMASQSK